MKSLCLGALVFLLSLPASAREMRVWTAEGFDPGAIKRAAFLPFARVSYADEGGRSVCPVGGESFYGCPVGGAAESELSRELGRALLSAGGPVSWVSQAELNQARSRLKGKEGLEFTDYGPWQIAIGREVQADAVLFGFIYCYRDRSGNAFASQISAALAFCLHLVDPKTGELLWSLRYQDEQRPLFENLLDLPSFIRRKGRFITAQDMAAEAAQQVVKHLPWSPDKKRRER